MHIGTYVIITSNKLNCWFSKFILSWYYVTVKIVFPLPEEATRTFAVSILQVRDIPNRLSADHNI